MVVPVLPVVCTGLHQSALCSIHNTYIQYIYTHYTASAKQKRPVAGGWPKTKSPKNDQNSIVLPSAPLLIRSIDKKEHREQKKSKQVSVSVPVSAQL